MSTQNQEQQSNNKSTVRRVRDYKGDLVDRNTVTKIWNGELYPNGSIIEVINPFDALRTGDPRLCNPIQSSNLRESHMVALVQPDRASPLFDAVPYKELLFVDYEHFLECFTSIPENRRLNANLIKLHGFAYPRLQIRFDSYSKYYTYEFSTLRQKCSEAETVEFYADGVRNIIEKSLLPPDVKLVEDLNTGSFVQEGVIKDPKKITAKYEKFISTKPFKESSTFNAFEGNSTKFGVEIETCIGRVPERLREERNWKCVYDGSLKDDNGNDVGGEYVTGVLSGDAGLDELQKICLILQKYTRINHKCGVHVHVNVERTPSNITALYFLAAKLEKELFAMMPPSRKTSTHCQSVTLKALSSSSLFTKYVSSADYKSKCLIFYKELYDKVEVSPSSSSSSMKASDEILSKVFKHPLGDKCKYKKDTPRYWWLNFVTALFARDEKTVRNDYKDFTIEFRQHSASLNFGKISNWVKICLAFVKYAAEKSRECIYNKVTLEDVIKYAYPKTHKELLTYIKERTEKFETVNDTAVVAEKVEYETVEEETYQSLLTTK